VIKPIRRNLLLEVLEDTDDWSDKIIKPQTLKNINSMGRVIAMAPDCIEPVSVGDKVIISYEPEEIKEFSIEDSGKKVFLVRENHALCVVEEIKPSCSKP